MKTILLRRVVFMWDRNTEAVREMALVFVLRMSIPVLKVDFTAVAPYLITRQGTTI